jgi:hypothetical protein
MNFFCSCSTLVISFLWLLITTTISPADQMWDDILADEGTLPSKTNSFLLELPASIDTFLSVENNRHPCRDACALVEHICEAHSDLIFLSEGIPIPICRLCPFDADIVLSTENLTDHLLEMHCQYATCPFKGYSSKISCSYVCEELEPKENSLISPITQSKPENTQAAVKLSPQIRRSLREIKRPKYLGPQESGDESASEFESARKKPYSPLENKNNTVLIKCRHKGCKRNFATQELLREHQYSHYPKETWLCCHLCDYQTPHANYLKTHEQYHSDVRPFPCTHPGCTYRAKRKSMLSDHMCLHSGVKRHACTQPGCTYKTIQKTNLNTHLRTTHHIDVAALSAKIKTHT